MPAELHIAFGIHNRNGYYIHALAAMHSVMKNASSPVKARILHDGTLSMAEQAQFQKVAAHSGGGGDIP